MVPGDDEGASLGRILQVGDLVLGAERESGRQDQPHEGVRVVIRPGRKERGIVCLGCELTSFSMSIQSGASYLSQGFEDNVLEVPPAD